jgi:hypothetical protein
MTTPAPPAPTPPPLPSQLVGGQPAQQQPRDPSSGQYTEPPQPPAPPAPPEPPEDTAQELRNALAEERRRHRETMQTLSQLQQQGMTDQEKAIEAAKAEGRAEAIRDAAKRVAQAEFRALAAGRLADPDAYLELLDLSPFIGEDGEIDKKALAKMVERLIAQITPAGARIPAGPMGNGEGADGDFLRAVLSKKR